VDGEQGKTSILQTTQPINIGLARLCCLGLVHSNDSRIPVLAWIGGIYSPKAYNSLSDYRYVQQPALHLPAPFSA